MIQILMMTKIVKRICKSSFVYAWYIFKNVFYKAYCFFTTSAHNAHFSIQFYTTGSYQEKA